MTWGLASSAAATDRAAFASRDRSARRKPGDTSGPAPITPQPEKPAETPLLVMLDPHPSPSHNQDHEAAMRVLEKYLILAKGRSSEVCE